MGRVYEVTFEKVLMSAAQDLLQIKGAAGKACKIRRLWLNNTNTALATAQMCNFRGRFLPATVTDGSGGSTPTPARTDPGDAAASFTALANNTTKATTSGTAVTVEESGMHVYNGYEKVFRPGSEPVVGPSESFVFELLDAPTGTFNASGGVEVEEIGG